jgi:hypothetical protein
MIRRHVGDEFWLIAQHDHALLAGHLAGEFGNHEYEPPQPRAIRGISLHDCGWPLHDQSPTLNSSHLPLDVFETPRHIGLAVWTESARRAAEADPYAGLLVSLHSLSLSVLATTATPFAHEKFDLSDAAHRFEVNKFQQWQVEFQEQLRQQLGMATGEPRRMGLAERSADPREQQLVFDFRLLQAMDKLSLAVCCTQPPSETIEPLLCGITGDDRPLRVRRSSEFELTVAPWPFRCDRLVLRVPCRRVPAQPFAEEPGFHTLYAAAPVEHFDFSIIKA